MKSRTPITFQRPNRTIENTIERAARAKESGEIVMPFLIYSNCQAIWTLKVLRKLVEEFSLKTFKPQLLFLKRWAGNALFESKRLMWKKNHRNFRVDDVREWKMRGKVEKDRRSHSRIPSWSRPYTSKRYVELQDWYRQWSYSITRGNQSLFPHRPRRKYAFQKATFRRTFVAFDVSVLVMGNHDTFSWSQVK